MRAVFGGGLNVLPKGLLADVWFGGQRRGYAVWQAL